MMSGPDTAVAEIQQAGRELSARMGGSKSSFLQFSARAKAKANARSTMRGGQCVQGCCLTCSNFDLQKQNQASCKALFEKKEDMEKAALLADGVNVDTVSLVGTIAGALSVQGQAIEAKTAETLNEAWTAAAGATPEYTQTQMTEIIAKIAFNNALAKQNNFIQDTTGFYGSSTSTTIGKKATVTTGSDGKEAVTLTDKMQDNMQNVVSSSETSNLVTSWATAVTTFETTDATAALAAANKAAQAVATWASGQKPPLGTYSWTNESIAQFIDTTPTPTPTS